MSIDVRKMSGEDNIHAVIAGRVGPAGRPGNFGDIFVTPQMFDAANQKQMGNGVYNDTTAFQLACAQQIKVVVPIPKVAYRIKETVPVFGMIEGAGRATIEINATGTGKYADGTQVIRKGFDLQDKAQIRNLILNVTVLGFTEEPNGEGQSGISCGIPRIGRAGIDTLKESICVENVEITGRKDGNMFADRYVRVATTASTPALASMIPGAIIDGKPLLVGDRVLVKNHGVQNGIYVIQGSGVPVRAPDAATGADFLTMTMGVITATDGTTNLNKSFRVTYGQPVFDSIGRPQVRQLPIIVAPTLGVTVVEFNRAHQNMHGWHNYGDVQRAYGNNIIIRGFANFGLVEHWTGNFESDEGSGHSTLSWHPAYNTYCNVHCTITEINANAYRSSGGAFTIWYECSATSQECFEYFPGDKGGLNAQNIDPRDVGAGVKYVFCQILQEGGLNYAFQASANGNDGEVNGSPIWYGNDFGNNCSLSVIGCSAHIDDLQDDGLLGVFSFCNRVVIGDCQFSTRSPVTLGDASLKYGAQFAAVNNIEISDFGLNSRSGLRIRWCDNANINNSIVQSVPGSFGQNTTGLSASGGHFPVILSESLEPDETEVVLESIESVAHPGGYLYNSAGRIVAEIDGCKTLEDNPGTDRSQPAWVVNTIYKAWATATVYTNETRLMRGSQWYEAKLDHTSSSTSEPGVGATWTTFWAAVDPAEVTHGGKSWKIIAAHTASLDKEPGVGANWATFYQHIPGAVRLHIRPARESLPVGTVLDLEFGVRSLNLIGGNLTGFNNNFHSNTDATFQHVNITGTRFGESGTYDVALDGVLGGGIYNTHHDLGAQRGWFVTDRGAWSSASVSYAHRDRVTHAGKVYIAHRAHVSSTGTVPGTGTTGLLEDVTGTVLTAGQTFIRVDGPGVIDLEAGQFLTMKGLDGVYEVIDVTLPIVTLSTPIVFAANVTEIINEAVSYAKVSWTRFWFVEQLDSRSITVGPTCKNIGIRDIHGGPRNFVNYLIYVSSNTGAENIVVDSVDAKVIGPGGSSAVVFWPATAAYLRPNVLKNISAAANITSVIFPTNSITGNDYVGRRFRGTVQSALPSTGSWLRGDYIEKRDISQPGSPSWYCIQDGTFGTLVGVTATTTLGSPDVTLNVATNVFVGQFLTIAGVLAGARVYVKSKLGNVITIDQNADAAVAGAAVAYSAPEWRKTADLQAAPP